MRWSDGNVENITSYKILFPSKLIKINTSNMERALKVKGKILNWT